MSEPINPTSSTTANLPTYAPASPETGIQTSLSLSSHIDSADLVAIAVSEAEAQIRVRLNTARREHAAAQRALTSLIGANALILSSWTREQADADARLTPLSDAVLPFWNQMPVRAYDDATYDKHSSTFSGNVRLSTDGFSFRLTYNGPAPAAYITNLTAIDEAKKKVEDLARNFLSCQSGLNNLDAVERKARAALGAAMAEKIKGGAELIDKIRASVNVAGLIDDCTLPA